MMKPNWPSKKRFFSCSCCCCCCKYLNRIWKLNQKQINDNNNDDDNVKLLLLGLDNAGKTTLALHLTGESVDDVVSTIGFTKYEFKKSINDNRSPINIILYDVGGSKKIRSIWSNYFALIHGIIFVIDSADIKRLDEIKQLLIDLITNSLINGKPILIYLNKQDLIDSMDEIDFCKKINIDEIFNNCKNNFMIKIFTISVKLQQQSSNIDGENLNDSKFTTIENGLKWLLNIIDKQWTILNERVRYESQQQILNENNKMKQRIDRIQKRRHLIEQDCNVKKIINDNDDEIIINQQPKSIVNQVETPDILLTWENPNSNPNPDPNLNSNSNEDDQKSIKSSTISTQSSSTINNNRPPLKRTNKIYPN